MSANSGIEWTDATWNPVTGCTEVSPGCDHCYAKTFAERFRGTPGHYFERGFDVQLRHDKLKQPLKWRKPRRIFVNSMSDLFHDSVPDDYIADVFAVMACNYLWYEGRRTHTFQLLTKRHARMRSLLSSEAFRASVASTAAGMSEDGDNVHDAVYFHYWPLPNVWLGVSTENQQWADIRIPALLDTPAAVRFISAEPLLSGIDLRQSLAKWTPGDDHPAWTATRWGRELKAHNVLHWVICGGESGRNDRPMHVDWARSLRDQCVTAGIPFLFKQWGSTVPLGQMNDEARSRWDDKHGGDVYPDESLWRIGKKAAGRELDGRTWDQYPEVAGV